MTDSKFQYLEALVRDRVNFIPITSKEITDTAVVISDGKLREAEAIICATGFAVYKMAIAPPGWRASRA